MLLHAERPLGISLRILPCNLSIQACTKSVGNHAKKSYLALTKQGKIPVFSALAFATACAKFYETYMIACTACSIYGPNSNIQYCI